MAYLLSPVLNDQQFDANGLPLAGGLIETYLAGTTTPVATYKTSTGSAQTNPIVLDATGNMPTGTQLWLDSGKVYKFVVKSSVGVTLRTIDNITPINDLSATQDEWVQYNATAFAYIGPTSFSVAGDQRGIFQDGRRVKTQNTAGLVYSTVTSTSYSAPNTTVNLLNDSGTLDAGLSAVSYAMLSATNPSVPAAYAKLASPAFTGNPTAPTAPPGTNTQQIATTAFVQSAANALAMPNYLSGLDISTSATVATITSGSAADSTNAFLMRSLSTYTKGLASWAVGSGNGGKLHAAAVANNTTYHWFEIIRPDTGVVDFGFDVSLTPTLPANYTMWRRIGSRRTNASAQWHATVQDGDLVQLDVPVLDIDVSNPGTTAVTRTLASIPTGIRVAGIFNAVATDSSNANNVLALFSDLSVADSAPSVTVAPLSSSSSASAGLASATTAGGAMKHEVMTNTSSQVRSRVQYVGSTAVLRMATIGWRDTRGR